MEIVKKGYSWQNHAIIKRGILSAEFSGGDAEMFLEDLAEMGRIAEACREGNFCKRKRPLFQQFPCTFQTAGEETAMERDAAIAEEGPSQCSGTYMKMGRHAFESKPAFQLIVNEAERLVEPHFATVVKMLRCREKIFHADHEYHAQLHDDALPLQGGIESAVHSVPRQMKKMELGGDIRSDRRGETPDEIRRRGKKIIRPLPEKSQMQQFRPHRSFELVLMPHHGGQEQRVARLTFVLQSRSQFQRHASPENVENLMFRDSVPFPGIAGRVAYPTSEKKFRQIEG